MLEGGWVQQNHDGLAGKAGFPQHAINEIHGGWFDPSNPVVPMTGRLRKDLVGRLNATQGTSDLVLVMGTSLSGVAADRLVASIGAKRAAATPERGEPLRAIVEEADERVLSGASPAGQPCLGAVIINVQQTRLDGLASLRIFSTCDKVCKLLAAELGVKVSTRCPSIRPPRDDIWSSLPYDASTGALVETSPVAAAAPASMSLDLGVGRRVKLALGNDELAPVGLEGVVQGKTAQGHYRIAFDDGKERVLGLWMMQSVKEGKLSVVPLLNV